MQSSIDIATRMSLAIFSLLMVVGVDQTGFVGASGIIQALEQPPSASASTSGSGSGSGSAIIPPILVPVSRKLINTTTTTTIKTDSPNPDTVSLNLPWAEIAYVAQVQFGTEQLEKTYGLQLDTGSSDTWVIGVGCHSPSDNSCTVDSSERGPDGAFDPTGDNSVVPVVSGRVKAGERGIPGEKRVGSGYGGGHVKYNIKYASAEMSGMVYNGRVKIGNHSAVIPFGVSTFEKGFRLIDGIVGLGFDNGQDSEINGALVDGGVKERYNSPNWFDALGFPLQQRVFSFWINQGKFSSFATRNGENAANALFGGIDSTQFNGYLSYFSVNMYNGAPKVWAISPDSWTVVMLPGAKISSTSARYGETRPPAYFTSPLIRSGERVGKVLIDTGTSGMTLPTLLANQIQAVCKMESDAFPFMLEFSKGDQVLPVAIGSMDICMRLIIGGAERGDMIILGDLFIHGIYLVFDKTMDPPLVGMAPLVWTGYPGSSKNGSRESIVRYALGSYPNAAMGHVGSCWCRVSVFLVALYAVFGLF